MWKSILQRINEKSASTEKNSQMDQFQLIKLTIVEMEQTILNTTDALTQAIGNQKSLELTAKQHLREAEKWKKDVADAIRIGDDTIGGKSLEYHKNSLKMHKEYSQFAFEATRPIHELKTQLDSLKQKLAEVKANDALLSAKKTGTQLQELIHNTPKNPLSSLLNDFENVEQNVAKEQLTQKPIKDYYSESDSIKKDLPVSKATREDFELIKAKFFGENKSGLEKNKEKIATFFGETNKQETTSLDFIIDSFFKDYSFDVEKQKQIDAFFTNN